MSLNYYISINDLTCKVYPVLWGKKAHKGVLLNNPFFIIIAIYFFMKPLPIHDVLGVISSIKYALPYIQKQVLSGIFPWKKWWQCVFHFWTKSDGMSVDSISPYISPSLSVILHVNCVWLFNKCLQQSFC